MFGQDSNDDQNQHNNPGYVNPQADNSGSLLGSDNPTDQGHNATAPVVTDDSPAFATPVIPAASATSNVGDEDDLLRIKQEALQHLSPLVSHLDQSAEEKFKTTMMMIQASDDQSLVGAAYETAKQIEDEKARAQALLDIINEINYFTQKNK